jgi:hypothetical protein
LILTIVILAFSNCKKEISNSNKINYDYVSYGTSFGECIGYCSNNIRITDTTINLIKKGWGINGLLPVVLIEKKIAVQYWDNLIQNIDYTDFEKIDSVIGCPDCADGGAEWIEIKNNNRIHKVTFEYNHEPADLKRYIGLLRLYKTAMCIDTSNSMDFNKIVLINQRGLIKNFICSRGCSQYLIQSIIGSDTVYYYDKSLNSDYLKDNLAIIYNGVLQLDSTMIDKPAPNDIPIPNFKVRNIKVFDIK